ncbi:hypothetical protein TNCT_243751 [Trichonephila clavata]|uniref:Uncharacterized protein n=1 Tax=Trichonephila clavata TaxID=2740835 RepID=A0A8X6GUG9_TRICU|nr:hypothetical protein TNCT_243751 [Trichonephila clavata]
MDPQSWYQCVGEENPADFLSRGLSADCLATNSRRWTITEYPKNLKQFVTELDYLTDPEKVTVVQERKKNA